MRNLVKRTYGVRILIAIAFVYTLFLGSNNVYAYSLDHGIVSSPTLVTVSTNKRVTKVYKRVSNRKAVKYTRRSTARIETATLVTGRPHGNNSRPGKWCGWWMRQQRGGGPELNVAWNWRHYGSPGAPQVGAVVVWRHHVGQIVGQANNGMWLVQSGNDGGAVRTRARSIKGAVIRI